MAQKELRRMNRVELIEIIYALEQNEEELKQENQELRKKLEERKVVVENARVHCRSSSRIKSYF